MTVIYAERNIIPALRDGRMVNAMSVDVEDYFHAQALAPRLPAECWDGLERRVEASTGRVLDLFQRAGIRATFFVLGWVAQRHPALVRRIVTEGHELASHGWGHARVDGMSPAEFRADLASSRAVLEDLGGVKVHGYRAPTFSIGERNRWAWAVIEGQGFRYSSSVYPIRHDTYGMPKAPRFAFHPLGEGRLIELPMTSVRLAGRNLPCAGGGYFRLLPYGLSRRAMAHVNQVDRRPGVFYFHPWEIDHGQPRIAGLPLRSRLRHYTNLAAMEARLHSLVADFAWDRIDRVLGLETGETP